MPGVNRRVPLWSWSARWRARLAIPSLLAAHDEHKVIQIAAGINGMVAIAVLTGLAWLVNLPLLFPALGPSAFILFSSPFSPAAAPRSVIGGHLIGLAAGCASWVMVSIAGGESVSLEAGGLSLLASASIAMAASCALLVRFSCPHPPACGSALVAALGVTNGWVPLLCMVAGVVVLTLQAILITRLAGVSVPLWSPRRDHSPHH